MEKPLDGGDVDLEGFNEIILGEDHKRLVRCVGDGLHAAFQQADEYRDSFKVFRCVCVRGGGGEV